MDTTSYLFENRAVIILSIFLLVSMLINLRLKILLGEAKNDLVKITDEVLLKEKLLRLKTKIDIQYVLNTLEKEGDMKMLLSEDIHATFYDLYDKFGDSGDGTQKDKKLLNESKLNIFDQIK